jgi:hypothetical protein
MPPNTNGSCDGVSVRRINAGLKVLCQGSGLALVERRAARAEWNAGLKARRLEKSARDTSYA